MRLSLLYNPFEMIERLAMGISRKRRLRKLKNTVAEHLKLGHIDSLELLEVIISDHPAAKKPPVIYDIGSNIGTWTLLAKALIPVSEIHAFEPLQAHNITFRSNCGKLSQVFLHEFCVGNHNGEGTINISSHSDSSSILESTDLAFDQYQIEKAGEEPVSIRKLSDLLDAGQLPPADIIKLDIQGFELEALKGIGNYLNSVRYIICEVSFKQYYHDQATFLDIASYLANYHFQIFAFGNNTPIGRELSQIDLLFKRIN